MARTADNDDLCVDATLTQPRERLQTVHPRQPHIEDDDVVTLPGEPVETGFSAVHRLHVVPLVLEHAA